VEESDRSACTGFSGEGDLSARWTIGWVGLRLYVKQWQRAVPGIETLFSGFPACSKLTTLKELPLSLTVQSLGVSMPTARFNPRYNTRNPQNMFMCSIRVCHNKYYFPIPYSPNALCPLWGTKWIYMESRLILVSKMSITQSNKLIYFVEEGCQNFPAIKEPHKNSRCWNFCTEHPQILRITVCNSVSSSKWRPKLVQLLFMKLSESHLLSLPQWPTYCISGCYILISCYSDVIIFKFWIKENLFCKRNCLDIQAAKTICNAAARTQINRGL
jgi:hypothetical protein